MSGESGAHGRGRRLGGLQAGLPVALLAGLLAGCGAAGEPATVATPSPTVPASPSSTGQPATPAPGTVASRSFVFAGDPSTGLSRRGYIATEPADLVSVIVDHDSGELVRFFRSVVRNPRMVRLGAEVRFDAEPRSSGLTAVDVEVIADRAGPVTTAP